MTKRKADPSTLVIPLEGTAAFSKTSLVIRFSQAYHHFERENDTLMPAHAFECFTYSYFTSPTVADKENKLSRTIFEIFFFGQRKDFFREEVSFKSTLDDFVDLKGTVVDSIGISVQHGQTRPENLCSPHFCTEPSFFLVSNHPQGTCQNTRPLDYLFSSTTSSMTRSTHAIISKPKIKKRSTVAGGATRSGKPKRVNNAYNYFFHCERQRILADRPQSTVAKSGRGKGGVGFAELGKLVAKRWRCLGDQEKEPYRQMYLKDKERFSREMEEWTNKAQSKEIQAKPALTVNELPESSFFQEQVSEPKLEDIQPTSTQTVEAMNPFCGLPNDIPSAVFVGFPPTVIPNEMASTSNTSAYCHQSEPTPQIDVSTTISVHDFGPHMVSMSSMNAFDPILLMGPTPFDDGYEQREKANIARLAATLDEDCQKFLISKFA